MRIKEEEKEEEECSEGKWFKWKVGKKDLRHI